MIKSFDIDKFLTKNPDIKPLIVKTEGESSKWGRVLCKWNEKKTNHEHIYSALINLQTGDIFLDCTKKKIYAKFIAHTALRPFHIAFKTLYHLAIPISIPHLIYQTISEGKKEDSSIGKKKLSNKEIAKNCLDRTVKSLADIVRTPAYGVALMVVSVAALIIGPLNIKGVTLYDLREIAGHLVQALYRNGPEAKKDLFICFQAFKNLKTIKKDDNINPEEDNTLYPPHASDTKEKLIDFASANIYFRRKHYAIFNNPFGKLDRKVRYVSASYGDVEKALEKAKAKVPEKA